MPDTQAGANAGADATPGRPRFTPVSQRLGGTADRAGGAPVTPAYLLLEWLEEMESQGAAEEDKNVEAILLSDELERAGYDTRIPDFQTSQQEMMDWVRALSAVPLDELGGGGGGGGGAAGGGVAAGGGGAAGGSRTRRVRVKSRPPARR